MALPRRFAFQGVAAAFSEGAVRHWWPDGIAAGFPTFQAAIAAVVDGSVDGAAIPVHNLIAGPVDAALAELAAAGAAVRITDEVELPIELCLLAVHGATIDAIRSVVSHPVALAQCAPFLSTLGARVVEHEDTAGAARDVGLRGDPSIAAIASAMAARAYDLDILARGVQARADNRTRFVRVERAEPAAREPGQTVTG
jgi:prephenate dehydratase